MVLCGAGGGGCPNPSGAPKVVAPSAKRGETFRFESSFQTWHWNGLRVPWQASQLDSCFPHGCFDDP